MFVAFSVHCVCFYVVDPYVCGIFCTLCVFLCCGSIRLWHFLYIMFVFMLWVHPFVVFSVHYVCFDVVSPYVCGIFCTLCVFLCCGSIRLWCFLYIMCVLML